MNFKELQKNIEGIVAAWMPSRRSRLDRKALDKTDFLALTEAGLTLTGVPENFGGFWHNGEKSALPIAMLFRKLATVDPSLALVATMHPTVLLMWMTGPTDRGSVGWNEQREMIFSAVKEGHWFGTVASEPGIGGDLLATKAKAKSEGDRVWRMSGDKFMASGSGMTSFMLTVAVPDGESRPEIFLVDMRDQVWNGSKGLTMIRPWDGIGMAATQSHAFRFDNVPVMRHGLLGGALDLLPEIGPIISFMFSAVFVGILDAAAAEAKGILSKRAKQMSPLEQSSWIKALNQIWLAERAFEGMARSLETQNAGMDALHGKLAIADLAESALTGLSHAIGGASLSQASPFGQWMQDVRALGYLRPPRALSYSRIFENSIKA